MALPLPPGCDKPIKAVAIVAQHSISVGCNGVTLRLSRADANVLHGELTRAINALPLNRKP